MKINSRDLSVQKQIRAKVIRNHGVGKVVCLTCGNAADKLRAEGLDVIEVGPRGILQTSEWLTPTQVASMWPDRFDATSGHLPLWMMIEIGRRIPVGEEPLYVNSGSGETALCIALANPYIEVTAVYDNKNPATEYNDAAPLNSAVNSACHVIRL